MKQFARLAALVALLLVGQAASAQNQHRSGPPQYDQFVVAEDVEVQYINGELRFCQRRNLKARICGMYTKVFGKQIFEVMDWWHADTFVSAYTGIQRLEVTGISPGQDGASLVIYYRPAQ